MRGWGVVLVVVLTFVTVDKGKEKSVYERIKKIPDLKEVYPLFARWDFLAIIEARSIKDATGVVVEKIRAIPGVKKTRTVVGAEL